MSLLLLSLLGAITSAPAGSTVKTTSDLNLRSGPGAGNSIVVVIPRGVAATASGEASSGWLRLAYAGRDGWASGKFLELASRPTPTLQVNAHSPNATESKWLHWVAQYAVSRVIPAAGSRDAALTLAARVSWWSLKEGLFDLSNPFVYSSCHYPSGDRRIGPLDVCPYPIWQVGIAGVQVAGKDLLFLKLLANKLYPGHLSKEVAGYAAQEAGFPAGTPNFIKVVNSDGILKASWLLRNHAIGFITEEPAITAECITGSRGWCYGTSWSTSAMYAPNKEAAMRSIADIREFLRVSAP